MRRFFWLFTVLCACSTSTVTQHELVDQILKARRGYEGKLTNSACLEYDGKKCKRFNVIAYDLKDQVFRETVNRLDFICNVGGKRYKVCMDSPNFCRKYTEEKCESWDVLKWFCKRTQKWEVLPSDPYQFLLDSRARCFSKTRYPFNLE